MSSILNVTFAKPKFNPNSTLVAIAATLINTVLRAYKINRRTTTTLDAMFDSLLGKVANRINKERAAKAVADGKSSYNKLVPTDILRASLRGEEENAPTIFEVHDWASKVARAVEYGSPIFEQDARALFASFAEAYVVDTQNPHMKLEDFTPSELAENEPIPSNAQILETVVETTASGKSA